MRDLAGLAETRADLRGVLEKEFSMDAAANLEMRPRVAHILSAWEEANAPFSSHGVAYCSKAEKSGTAQDVDV